MRVVDGLVSAIIPAYQQERVVRETIASVQAQTYGNLQIVVADDASTDGTTDVVADLAREDPHTELFVDYAQALAALADDTTAAGQAAVESCSTLAPGSSRCWGSGCPATLRAPPAC